MQPFVIYQKNEPFRLWFSQITDASEYSPDWELENNILPNQGGTRSDYGVVYITEEQHTQAKRRRCWVDETGGMPNFKLGEFLPPPPKSPSIAKRLSDVELLLAEAIARGGI